MSFCTNCGYRPNDGNFQAPCPVCGFDPNAPKAKEKPKPESAHRQPPRPMPTACVYAGPEYWNPGAARKRGFVSIEDPASQPTPAPQPAPQTIFQPVPATDTVPEMFCAVYAGPDYFNPPAPAPAANTDQPAPAPAISPEFIKMANEQFMMVYGGPEFFNPPADPSKRQGFADPATIAGPTAFAQTQWTQPSIDDAGIATCSCGAKMMRGQKFCCECGAPNPFYEKKQD